ncbi:hypothetical protein HII28_07375 [Planctomonas sp. JC2975]|nr:hypothetical protein [Planctomonas sp. JC2975]
MTATGFTFGIYPLRVAGTPFGVADGPADDYARIRSALSDLAGVSSLTPRTYLIYTPSWEERMLDNAEVYADNGLLGDVVIGCGDWTDAVEQELELERWVDFVRTIVRRHGERLSSVQITNEPNLSFMEGSKAYIYDALVRGVVAAKHEVTKLGLSAQVGFGSVPDSQVAVPGYWDTLQNAARPEFLAAVDFVGHNFYVDVFEDGPVALQEIPETVEGILSALRTHLTGLGLPSSVAIRVTENGWPTGTNQYSGRVRSPEEQATVLEAVIRTVYDLRVEYNVSRYVLFGLRDADSGESDIFHQYGIVRDDYTPKPAFTTYQRLIQQLSD